MVVSVETSANPIAGSPPAAQAPAGLTPGIAQVIPELDAGGAERSCVEIASAVARAGWRSFVITTGGRLAAELEAAGVTVIPLDVRSKNPATLWRNAGRLRRLIRRHGIHLVHARSRAPAWSARAAARREGAVFVTTYHGKVHDGPWWKRHYNSVMADGDAVIANSAFTAARIRAVHAIDPARLHTVPRGFDLARFDPARVTPEAVARMRAAWGVDADHASAPEPLVLLPARLTRWKGPLLLIEAAARMAAPARFVLAGDHQGREDFRREVEALIRARGLEERVRLAGHVDDMPTALAAADVVVSASLDPEPFGRTTVEAQAMARCVVAPDHGGAREQVVTAPEDQRTGWLFTPGAAASLAAVLDTVLALPAEDRAQVGARGRAQALARFTTQAMCTATLAIYRDLLLRARQPTEKSSAERA